MTASNPSEPNSDLEQDAAAARRVLIVDESRENREVMRTVLERKGLEILEAWDARTGLDLARHFHPDVIVLDLDAEEAENAAVQEGFESESRNNHSCLLVLGRSRQYAAPIPADCVLAKPYHYAPLIRKIEQLAAAVKRAA